jgi:holliday junction resolvase YEN1
MSSSDDVTVFLTTWRSTLATELEMNQSGLLGKWRPHMAQAIPSDFPDIDIIRLYVDPLSSLHSGVNVAVPACAPDVVHLARFVEDNFVWGNLLRILKSFSTSVFPGLALCELVDAAKEMDLGLQPHSITMTGKVFGLRQSSGASSGHALEIHALLLMDCVMIKEIEAGLVGKVKPRQKTTESTETWLDWELPRLRAWLPLAILRCVVPEKISSFQCA